MDGTTPLPTQPRERIEHKKFAGTLKFSREPFREIVTDMGPLMRKHDREVWPERKWGRLALNIDRYMQMEATGVLMTLSARHNRTLVGYSFDIVIEDEVYRIPTATNAHFFLHPDYRSGGAGLSPRGASGFQFLEFRERLLDEMKIIRRRFGTKAWLMFGPLLERLGYSPELVTFHRIVTEFN